MIPRAKKILHECFIKKDQYYFPRIVETCFTPRMNQNRKITVNRRDLKNETVIEIRIKGIKPWR